MSVSVATGVSVIDASSPKGAAFINRAGMYRKTQVPLKLYGQFQNSAGLLGVTNHITYEVPFDWIALRVHVENMAATAQIKSLVAVAVSNDGTVAPTAPSGSWNNVLFSGVAAFSSVACTSGAGTDSAITTDITSDWLTLPSIARTDGGTGRVLMLRHYVPAAGNTTGNRADIASTSLALSVTKVKTYFKAGDFVTTPAGFTTPTEWTMAPTIWFEFLTPSGQISLYAVGDSITQGSDSTPIINIGGAGRLSFASFNGDISYLNQGWASQISSVYYQNGLNKLAITKPSVAAFCPWSPNDTDKYTQAGVDRCNRQALQWVQYCVTNQIIPALITPAPVNGLTTGEEGFRRQVVQYVKALCATSVAVLLDRDSVYTDYSSASGGFKAGLNSTTLHPNGTGYALEGQLWTSVLSNIL